MGDLNAPLDPKESVASIIQGITTKTLQDTGKFLNRDGTETKW